MLYETGSQGNVFPGIALQFLNGILLGVGFRFLDHPPPHCHGVVLVCTCIFVIKLACLCVCVRYQQNTHHIIMLRIIIRIFVVMCCYGNYHSLGCCVIGHGLLNKTTQVLLL